MVFSFTKKQFARSRIGQTIPFPEGINADGYSVEDLVFSIDLGYLLLALYAVHYRQDTGVFANTRLHIFYRSREVVVFYGYDQEIEWCLYILGFDHSDGAVFSVDNNPCPFQTIVPLPGCNKRDAVAVHCVDLFGVGRSHGAGADHGNSLDGGCHFAIQSMTSLDFSWAFTMTSCRSKVSRRLSSITSLP